MIESTYGARHPVFASACNNIAYIEKQQGQYEKALSHYEKALKVYKDICGEKHKHYISTLINVGQVYRAMGMLEKGMTSLSHLETADGVMETAMTLQRALGSHGN